MWKILKQFELEVEHIWTLHFEKKIVRIPLHPGNLHLFIGEFRPVINIIQSNWFIWNFCCRSLSFFSSEEDSSYHKLGLPRFRLILPSSIKALVSEMLTFFKLIASPSRKFLCKTYHWTKDFWFINQKSATITGDTIFWKAHVYDSSLNMHRTDQHHPYVCCNLQSQLNNQHQHGYFLFYPSFLPI